MSEQIIRWGIIGCGDVCEVKSGPAIYKTPQSKLVAVMRRDVDKAADFAKRHNVEKVYADAEALLRDPEIDIVYVATPPGSHFDYALRVAAAGKHAYVEKPMARNATEARLMNEAFAQAGKKLFVAYYRRTLPVFAKAKEIIDSGTLGTITAVSHRHSSPAHRRVVDPLPWRLQVEQAGAGLFLDLASHVFDAIDYLTGPFKDVKAHAVNLASDHDAEDVIGVTWRSERGAIGTSLWNFAAGVSEDVIEVTGTEGRVSWAAFGGGTVTVTRGKGVETFDAPYPPHVHQPLIETIVAELLGRGQSPSTGATALRTQTVMDQCLVGYYGDRSGAFWEHPERWPGRRA